MDGAGSTGRGARGANRKLSSGAHRAPPEGKITGVIKPHSSGPKTSPVAASPQKDFPPSLRRKLRSPTQPPVSQAGPSTPRRSQPPPLGTGKKRKSHDAGIQPPTQPYKRATLVSVWAEPKSTIDPVPDLDPLPACLDPIDDIGHCVKIMVDQPTNVTGHFCDLFIGKHDILGKVALKRPRIGSREYSEVDIRRFRREADTWRNLVHDHILRFIGTCQIDGYLYMVSPFIENGTLNNYVGEHPEVDRTRLLYETAEAIAYLHRSGVIHGDIKSNNILVSEDLHALLCDFGLTKLATSSTSTALRSAGSLRWQAPELWDENSPKSYSSDTYAFGMAIVEVLTGRVPFAKYEHPSGVIMAVSQRNERPATEPMFSVTGAPYYLTWRAAIHCWAKDPTRRLPMADIAEMLKPRLPTNRASKSGTTGTTTSESASASALTAEATLTFDDTPLEEDDTQVDDRDEDDKPYCYCERGSFGEMVPCEGKNCPIEWFHLGCLGMHSMPDGDWLCLRCEAVAVSH